MHMAVSNTPASKTLTPTLIFSLLRLSADSLALAVSASQPLKSGTLSFYLSIPVPVLIPSVVISRPTTVSRHFNPHNPSPLAPHIRLLLTTVRVYKLYLVTYLLTQFQYTRSIIVTFTWQIMGKHALNDVVIHKTGST